MPAEDQLSDRVDAFAGIAGTGGRPGRLGSIIVLIVWGAVLARVFIEQPPARLVSWYVVCLVVFLAVQLFVLWRPALPVGVLYVAFAMQAALVLLLLSLNRDRDFDFITALLAVEAYLAALLFAGRPRITWVGVSLALIPVSLVLAIGLLQGIARSLVPLAGGIVLAMFAIVSQELEASRAQSEGMVADLREAQRRLEAHAGQVEELAAIEERSRVAKDLEASVSFTLDEALATTRAAKKAQGGSQEASALLDRLQALAQQALAQMRGIIAELRPPAA